MWMIISIFIILAGFSAAIALRRDWLFFAGAVMAIGILITSVNMNDIEYSEVSHKDPIVSVVSKPMEGTFIVGLQREGYVETNTLNTSEIEYVDSEEKTVSYVKTYNTDRWTVMWDTIGDGKRIVSYPLDEIKLVK